MNQKNSGTTYLIEPPRGLAKFDFSELWRYKDLFYFLVWRNIKVRYKQTVIGVIWAVFQPLVTMAIFTIFFGLLVKVPSEGIPYGIFVYTGLLYWNFFSTALSGASASLVEDESIIKKVYFPRIIVPLSTSLTPVIDFGFALLALGILMVIYGFMPNFWALFLIPVLVLITFLSASGLGLFLASLNVKYRDVRYILGFFIQILLYVTPVIYPVSLVPEKFKWLFYLNPMTGVITAARETLLKHHSPDWILLGASLGVSLIFVFFGLIYFRKTERFFADII